MSSSRWKCKKCHCTISEETCDRLCDNCNMNLIAQNLAAELLQHEIHREDTEPPAELKNRDAEDGGECSDQQDDPKDCDVKSPVCAERVEAMESENDITASTAEVKSELEVLESVVEPREDKTSLGSDEQSFCDRNPAIPCSEADDEKNASKSEAHDPGLIEESRKDEAVDVSAESDLWIDQIQPKKRKPPTPRSDDSDDEPDFKKADYRPEPMRTRAKQQDAVKQHDDDTDKVADHDEGEEEDDSKGPMRRVTRKVLSEIEKYKHPVYESTQAKSRRTKQFKAKQVYKAPTSQASIYSSHYVFYKSRYYQVGDVVLLRDLHRPGDYFAQITSFLTDQYCHKCATIQWLLPTKQSPESGFDPRTYILGYLDETPRPLSSLLPVMRLPSDYYRFYKSPYPSPTPDPLGKHYLWIRSQPVSLDPAT